MFPFDCLQEECQNYVRVLLISGTTLFTCGTNAFTPVCATRQVGTTLRADGVNVEKCYSESGRHRESGKWKGLFKFLLLYSLKR